MDFGVTNSRMDSGEKRAKHSIVENSIGFKGSYPRTMSMETELTFQ
jgi:hypothetical protein